MARSIHADDDSCLSFALDSSSVPIAHAQPGVRLVVKSGRKPSKIVQSGKFTTNVYSAYNYMPNLASTLGDSFVS